MAARCRQCCVGEADSIAWAVRVVMRALCAWAYAGPAGILWLCQDEPPGHNLTGPAPSEPGRSRVSGRQGARRHETPVANSELNKEIEMSTSNRSRMIFSAFVAVLTFALCAPIAVNADEVTAAEEPILAAAPAAPSWDEFSGYSSVEASRAGVNSSVSGEVISSQERALAMTAAAAASWDEATGYGSLETSRAVAAINAPVAPSSWDETSGYGAVEASRANR